MNIKALIKKRAKNSLLVKPNVKIESICKKKIEFYKICLLQLKTDDIIKIFVLSIANAFCMINVKSVDD